MFFPRSWGWMFLLGLILIAVTGCKTIPTSAVGFVSSYSIPKVLTDDDAARLAMRNNAAFRKLLIDMEVADAELILANQLPNPNFLILFPLGPKQIEYTLQFSAEALCLRPHRSGLARRNADLIGERLVQDGLNLVRDVKVACADLRLAAHQEELGRQKADLLKRFNRLANVRLKAGDISELEASTTELDYIQARIDLDRLPIGEKLAREKLRNLLGISTQPAEFTLASPRPLPIISLSEGEILKTAWATRPDLRGAEIAIEVEAKRVGLVEKEWLQITAIFDANGSSSNFEAGPGINVVIPIFHQNQGQKAIANAKLKKACRHYVVVRDQIALEVRQSLARYRQARNDLRRIRDELLPAINESIAQTEQAWEAGDISYLFVLESTRKAHTARVTEAEILAEWYREAAELERSVGAPLTEL